MKYTKEQKQAYFRQLRNRWKASRELADKDETARALFKETGGDYSYYSFYFTLMDMRAAGFDGLPYIDCKTFKGWQEAGFKVKKGEHSKISGIVWLSFNKGKENEEGEEEDFVYPKMYHLFHRSQVEER